MKAEISKSKSTVEEATKNLSELSKELDQLMSTSYGKMEETMTHASFAKVNLNLAYAINALYYGNLIIV